MKEMGETWYSSLQNVNNGEKEVTFNVDRGELSNMMYNNVVWRA